MSVVADLVRIIREVNDGREISPADEVTFVLASHDDVVEAGRRVSAETAGRRVC